MSINRLNLKNYVGIKATKIKRKTNTRYTSAERQRMLWQFTQRRTFSTRTPLVSGTPDISLTPRQMFPQIPYLYLWSQYFITKTRIPNSFLDAIWSMRHIQSFTKASRFSILIILSLSVTSLLLILFTFKYSSSHTWITL